MSEEEIKEILVLLISDNLTDCGKRKLKNYIEQLQQESKKLKKQLYSPDQVETTCPKCGEKLYINYSREVYDLKQENYMLKQAVDNTYETSQDIMYEMQQENEHNKNILTGFEKWLEYQIRQCEKETNHKQFSEHDIEITTNTMCRFQQCLDKLQELKEGNE